MAIPLDPCQVAYLKNTAACEEQDVKFPMKVRMVPLDPTRPTVMGEPALRLPGYVPKQDGTALSVDEQAMASSAPSPVVAGGVPTWVWLAGAATLLLLLGGRQSNPYRRKKRRPPKRRSRRTTKRRPSRTVIRAPALGDLYREYLPHVRREDW